MVARRPGHQTEYVRSSLARTAIPTEKSPKIKSSIPMPPDDGSCRIPWTMNLILILLETDEPPTADSHAQKSEDASYDCTRQECAAASSCQGDEKAAPCACYQCNGQGEVPPRRSSAELTTEYWKQSINFNGKESQREDVRSGWKTRGKNSRRHHGRICGYRSW